MAKNATLSTNQRRALLAFLECPTLAAASEQCGLSRRTLYRYLSQPHFRAALHQRQDQQITATTAALQKLAGDAVKTLDEIRQDKTVAAGVRARACSLLLEHGRRLVETNDILERISRLENDRNR